MLLVKIFSNLGIINPPLGTGKKNIGVESGPEAISKVFNAKKIKILEAKFPDSSEISKSEYKDLVLGKYTDLKNKILHKMDGEDFLVTIGGDHSVAYASVSAILDRGSATSSHNSLKTAIGGKKRDATSKSAIDETAIVMFDSHADLHSWQSSPSGNFHGMWLRQIIQDYQLPPQNILYIGNLIMEEAEIKFMAKNKIQNYNSEDFLRDPGNFISEVNSFLKNFKHVHISFDVDVLSNVEMSATGCFVEDGFSKEQILKIIKNMKKDKIKSLDLVEFNPKRSTSSADLLFVEEILKEFCSEHKCPIWQT